MPTTYIGSWAFIALVIVLTFLVNFHSFILEVIRVNSSNSPSFQAHLKLVYKFFSYDGGSIMRTCL
jgi:hypothetical protein